MPPHLKAADPEPFTASEHEYASGTSSNDSPDRKTHSTRRWLGIPIPKNATIFRQLNYVHKYSTVPYLIFIPFHLFNVLALPTALSFLYSKEEKYQLLNEYYFLLKELNGLIKFTGMIVGGLSLHIVSGIILNQWKNYRKNIFIKRKEEEEEEEEKPVRALQNGVMDRKSWFRWKNWNYNAITGRVAVPLIMYHLYLVKLGGIEKLGSKAHETIMEAISDFIRHNFWEGTVPFVTLVSVVLYHTSFGVSRYFNHNRLNPSKYQSRGWYVTAGAIVAAMAGLMFV
ncbi:hypothetical protein AWRI3579_g4396 [Hanseniaspora osmophila]|uniref:Mitochondrial adapter protein MCP1 transmembrane domain-containing protein n=1 Tax=Hanseniaspora osmophila TaxID=56408 RepID=A0A1E5R0P3_9ASCO|nr:hypothetical protein AWRI3579_g4396 [Hanseniaspora osmophila]